ncbi:MAG: stalk domain-containing protein [Defluviitaleaceae bacterium]|nr:stalk domain-containing protein [Defluviitaleaceae bacterium]
MVKSSIKRRAFAWLIALVMAFGTVAGTSTTAFAQEANDEYVVMVPGEPEEVDVPETSQVPEVEDENEAAPEETIPEEYVPEEYIPEEYIPEEYTPEELTPEAPEVEYPELEEPETEVSELEKPKTEEPEFEAPIIEAPVFEELIIEEPEFENPIFVQPIPTAANILLTIYLYERTPVQPGGWEFWVWGAGVVPYLAGNQAVATTIVGNFPDPAGPFEVRRAVIELEYGTTQMPGFLLRSPGGWTYQTGNFNNFVMDTDGGGNPVDTTAHILIRGTGTPPERLSDPDDLMGRIVITAPPRIHGIGAHNVFSARVVRGDESEQDNPPGLTWSVVSPSVGGLYFSSPNLGTLSVPTGVADSTDIVIRATYDDNGNILTADHTVRFFANPPTPITLTLYIYEQAPWAADGWEFYFWQGAVGVPPNAAIPAPVITAPDNVYNGFQRRRAEISLYFGTESVTFATRSPGQWASGGGHQVSPNLTAIMDTDVNGNPIDTTRYIVTGNMNPANRYFEAAIYNTLPSLDPGSGAGINVITVISINGAGAHPGSASAFVTRSDGTTATNPPGLTWSVVYPTSGITFPNPAVATIQVDASVTTSMPVRVRATYNDNSAGGGGVELSAEGLFAFITDQSNVNVLNFSNPHGLPPITQGANIFHAWNMSFNEIRAQLPEIAQAGFNTIQTSPIGESLFRFPQIGNDGLPTPGYFDRYVGTWWMLYQPTRFQIGNMLGTEAEFRALAGEAAENGIHIIVDAVPNHTTSWWNEIHPDLRHPELFHSTPGDGSQWDHNISNWGNRQETTRARLLGLIDFYTGSPVFQSLYIDFLRTKIEAGASGFRYDAMVHIESPGEPYPIGSDFWTYVSTSVDSMISSLGRTPFQYGEVLGPGYRQNIYLRDIPGMLVTPYYFGNHIRTNSITRTTQNLVTGDNGWDSNTFQVPGTPGGSAARMVPWVESHDQYGNEGVSRGLNDAQIRVGWALITARADTTPLFFARPGSGFVNNGQVFIPNSDGSYSNAWGHSSFFQDPAIVTINWFANYYIGQPEYTSTHASVAMIERGPAGAFTGVVLANAGTVTRDVDFPTQMVPGEYTCQVTGQMYTVANGRITGPAISGRSVLVIFDGENLPPVVHAYPETSDFTDVDGVNVTLTALRTDTQFFSVSVNGTVTVPPTAFENLQEIIIGAGAEIGDVFTLTLTGTANGAAITPQTFTYTKVAPSEEDGKRIELVRPDWDTARIWARDSAGNYLFADWYTAPLMTRWYESWVFTFPSDVDVAYVMFHNGEGDQMGWFPVSESSRIQGLVVRPIPTSPDVSAFPGTSDHRDSASTFVDPAGIDVILIALNTTSQQFTLRRNGVTVVPFTDFNRADQITIGAGAEPGDIFVLTVTGTDGVTTDTQTFVYVKGEPGVADRIRIEFVTDRGWAEARAWTWGAGGNIAEPPWPGTNNEFTWDPNVEAWVFEFPVNWPVPISMVINNGVYPGAQQTGDITGITQSVRIYDEGQGAIPTIVPIVPDIPNLPPLVIVAAAKDAANDLIGFIPGDNASSVTGNVTLPDTFERLEVMLNVTWTSSHPDIACPITGTVTRPDSSVGDVQVTLIATFAHPTNPNVTLSREFVITVLALLGEDIEHTVTFVLRGGNINGNTADITVDVLEGETLALGDVPADPELEGYVFLGWTPGVIAESDIITDEDLVDPVAVVINAPTTFSAVWLDEVLAPTEQVVTLNANGGTFADGTATRQVTLAITGNTYATLYQAANLPTGTDYDFTGWFTASTGGTPVLATTPVTAPATRTLYAQWEPIENEDNNNDGSGNVQPPIQPPTISFPAPPHSPGVTHGHAVRHSRAARTGNIRRPGQATAGNQADRDDQGSQAEVQLEIPANDGQVTVQVTVLQNQATLQLPFSTVRELTGTDLDGIVSFDLTSLTNVTAATLPREALRFITATGFGLEILLPQAIITLDTHALHSLNQQAIADEVTIFINFEPTSELSVMLRIYLISGGRLINLLEGEIIVTVYFDGSFPVEVWFLDENYYRLMPIQAMYNSELSIVTIVTGRVDGLFIISSTVDIPGGAGAITPPQANAVATLQMTIGSIGYIREDGTTGFLETAPFIADDRTMVPLRFIIESFSAMDTTIDWIEETRTVQLLANGELFTLTVDMPLPDGMGTPVIVYGRTFVPLRFIMEALGADVIWDSETQTITIIQ